MGKKKGPKTFRDSDFHKAADRVGVRTMVTRKNLRKAVKDILQPGPGITSVSFGVKGGPQTTITAAEAREIDRNLAAEEAAEGSSRKYELLSRDDETAAKVYDLLDKTIEKWHDHLSPERVAVAWHRGLTPNADGQILLGKCKIASELEREFHAFDVVIILNYEVWHDRETTDKARTALLDHELSHAVLKLDKEGEPIEDYAGRKKLRNRKHDVEEFTAVVERHGTYKGDLQKFAQALAKRKAAPLFANADKPAAEPEPAPAGA